jgi:hypothetical protein
LAHRTWRVAQARKVLDMETALAHRRLAYAAGVAGIAAQVASAYFFLLYPLLIVPTPASYVFFAAWFFLVGLAIAWLRHHPWRSFLVPIVTVPLVIVVLEIGIHVLGWAG